MSQHINPMAASAMSLYDDDGNRLYINEEERHRFLEAAMRAGFPKRQFGVFLALTGCRLSEGRGFRWIDLQATNGRVSLRTLKRRKKKKPIRELPAFPLLLEELTDIKHCIHPSGRLWHSDGQPIPRSTAYRWIKDLMERADIRGKQASPKGLRHGFAAWATLSGVPLDILKKWMGHASLETTQVYTQLCGPDEMRVARRMWGSPEADFDLLVEAVVARISSSGASPVGVRSGQIEPGAGIR